MEFKNRKPTRLRDYDYSSEGVYFVTNLIWKVSPVLTTGVEYLWGSRKNMDGTLHHNNRVQASLRVNF